MHKAFRGQLEAGADAVAIRTSADEQTFHPMIGVCTVIAKQRGIISAIVGDDSHASIIVEIPIGSAPAHDRLLQRGT